MIPQAALATICMSNDTVISTPTLTLHREHLDQYTNETTLLCCHDVNSDGIYDGNTEPLLIGCVGMNPSHIIARGL